MIEVTYLKLREQANSHFSTEALNKAVLELHTQDSTMGRLRIPASGSNGKSTHLMLNIAFLHAALGNRRHDFDAAFRDFEVETLVQDMKIDRAAVKRDTLRIAKNLRATLSVPDTSLAPDIFPEVTVISQYRNP